jgi:hypothetical protein
MNAEGHLSKLELDLVMIEAARAETRAHVEQCTRCRSALDGMLRERDAFLIAHPRRPKMTERPRLDRRKIAGTLFALAAAIAMFVVIDPRTFRDPEVRAKGPTDVELWVKPSHGAAVRFQQQSLAAGDTLVFRYTTGKRYLLVLDVEASGKIAPVIAETDGSSLAIEPGKNEKLESAPLIEQLAQTLPKTDRNTLDVGALGAGDESSWLIVKEPR